MVVKSYGKKKNKAMMYRVTGSGRAIYLVWSGMFSLKERLSYKDHSKRNPGRRKNKWKAQTQE